MLNNLGQVDLQPLANAVAAILSAGEARKAFRSRNETVFTGTPVPLLRLLEKSAIDAFLGAVEAAGLVKPTSLLGGGEGFWRWGLPMTSVEDRRFLALLLVRGLYLDCVNRQRLSRSRVIAAETALHSAMSHDATADDAADPCDVKASTPERPPKRRAIHTQKRILTLCRRKALKGITIARRLELNFDYVRHILSQLVSDGLLTNMGAGYKTRATRAPHSAT